MRESEENTVSSIELEFLNLESPESDMTIAFNFDPVKTAAKDAEEVIWKYADKIGEVILK